MLTDKVQEYFRTWIAHLTLNYSEKVPLENSPQLEMFWREAARMGPERFCDAVQYSTANNWATLHERKDNETSRQKQKKDSASESDIAFAKVVEGISKFDYQIQNAELRKFLGEKIAKAASAVGWDRFSNMNDFNRAKVREAFDKEFNGKP